MHKKHQIIVIGVPFQLETREMEKLLTKRAFTLAKKVIRQGGELNFGINSIKPELLQNEKEA